ncbi:retrovirus-related pol polyprotein from transposon TNT 1-94 [Tanacetum coccineum]
MVTVRCLFSINIKNNWFIEQLNINNAFLHGDLNEEVYMKVPKGYPQTLDPNTICKLTKSFYGLKLANRQWFEKPTTFLIQLVFKQSYVDTSLFTITYNGTITSLLVYVDDILLISKDGNFIKEIKTKLHDKNSTGLAMTQRKYASELLECADVLDIKPIATPMDTTIKLNDSDGYLLPDPSTYRTLVGKLLYLTITRPDLSFTAQALNSTCEISWLKCLLLDLGVHVPTPSLVMCDNASTIALANYPIHHARTKHIETDCHFVKDKIRQGEISPCFVPTRHQIANILAKGLCKSKRCADCLQAVKPSKNEDSTGLKLS